MPRGTPNSTLEERFLKRVILTPCVTRPDLEPCHIWQGGVYGRGYGEVLKKTYGTHFAHQWASHHWNGSPLPVEKGMEVSHHCDTRLCVNPKHLIYQPKETNQRIDY
jgi:hypothetical protein